MDQPAALAGGARTLLESDAYQYAYAEAYFEIQDRWAIEHDPVQREKLHGVIHALSLVDQHLHALVNRYEAQKAQAEQERLDAAS